MLTHTRHYSFNSGWSGDFPDVDSENTLILAFGATRFIDDPTALNDLRAAFPRAAWLGCSTSGEIYEDEVHDDSLVVAIVQFEHTRLRTVSVDISHADESLSVGQKLARGLNQHDLSAVFVLSDGLTVNGSELVRGIGDILPDTIPVTGGLAGDGDRFKCTWVSNDGVPRSGCVTAVGLYGSPVHVGHGSEGGWRIFGPERRITKSRQNELLELDGRPALDLYREYLGEHAKDLPASALRFPLAIRDESGSEVVRTILSVDDERRSLTFAGNVPEGFQAQLMHANLESLVDGACAAVSRIVNECGRPDSNRLSIAISCVGRKLLLGVRSEEEVEAVLEQLPNSRQVGFYSYGEISPSEGSCGFHNQTMTLTTISEV